MSFGSSFPVTPQSLDIASSQHPLCGEAPAEDKGQPVCSYFRRRGRNTTNNKTMQNNLLRRSTSKNSTETGSSGQFLLFCWLLFTILIKKRCFTPLLADGANNGRAGKKLQTSHSTGINKYFFSNKKKKGVAIVWKQHLWTTLWEMSASETDGLKAASLLYLNRSEHALPSFSCPGNRNKTNLDMADGPNSHPRRAFHSGAALHSARLRLCVCVCACVYA